MEFRLVAVDLYVRGFAKVENPLLHQLDRRHDEHRHLEAQRVHRQHMVPFEKPLIQ